MLVKHKAPKDKDVATRKHRRCVAVPPRRLLTGAPVPPLKALPATLDPSRIVETDSVAARAVDSSASMLLPHPKVQTTPAALEAWNSAQRCDAEDRCWIVFWT